MYYLYWCGSDLFFLWPSSYTVLFLDYPKNPAKLMAELFYLKSGSWIKCRLTLDSLGSRNFQSISEHKSLARTKTEPDSKGLSRGINNSPIAQLLHLVSVDCNKTTTKMEQAGEG